jgi:hypothetical protein
MEPTGFASSPREVTLLNPPENVVALNFNLVHYTNMQRAGDFGFWEQPELMVADCPSVFPKATELDAPTR